MIQEYQLEPGLHQARIRASWADLAGAFVARHTTSLHLQDRVLRLKIDSAPIRNELRYNKSKVIREINTFLGASVVEDILLR